MKKYTILTIALVFGFLTASTSTINAFSQDDTLKQRTPVSVAELPREITEAIGEEFEDYRITFAFKYSKTDAEGLEGTTQGTGRSERMGTEMEKMHEGMEQGTERMRDTLQGAERTGREGMKEGAEIMETGREGMHEEMHEGAERLETESEEMQDTLQGAERTTREGMHQGAEKMETGRENLQDTLQGAERPTREGMHQGAERAGIPETPNEFLFTDEYDTYYEIRLEGPDMKTVWYSEEGERIENETESTQRR